MEELLTNAISTGNATAVVAALAVYLIIHVQRRNSGNVRDTEIDTIYKQLHELQIDKELLEKDIDTLKEESAGIKEDIREIKKTLQDISIAIAQIAAKYEVKGSK